MFIRARITPLTPLRRMTIAGSRLKPRRLLFCRRELNHMSDFSKPGHRAFALTVFLAVVAGQCPEPLSACSCAGPPPPPMEALAQSDHVFHGTVVSIDTSDPTSHFVRFETHAVWKGAADEELEVRTASSSAACGVLFVQGLDYVVYAYDTTQDGVTTTNSCCRTRPHSPEEAAAQRQSHIHI